MPKGQIPPGLAAYLAKKRTGAATSATPSTPTAPILSHQMVTAIRASKKGKLPPGLAKYAAAKKVGK